MPRQPRSMRVRKAGTLGTLRTGHLKCSNSLSGSDEVVSRDEYAWAGWPRKMPIGFDYTQAYTVHCPNVWSARPSDQNNWSAAERLTLRSLLMTSSDA
jgi:hypothetical protein